MLPVLVVTVIKHKNRQLAIKKQSNSPPLYHTFIIHSQLLNSLASYPKMKTPIIFTIVFLFILGFACSNKVKTQFDTFSIFVSTWQLQNSSPFESWENHSTNLSWQVIKIENADTLIVEELRIFTDRNAAYHEATIPSQNNGKPVRFKLIRQTNNEFQSENPNHDFPKK